MMRATAVSLLLCGCSLFEAEPRPALDAWDPPTVAGSRGAPCPGWAPYVQRYHYTAIGERVAECTTRPFDPDNEDVDALGGGLP